MTDNPTPNVFEEFLSKYSKFFKNTKLICKNALFCDLHKAISIVIDEEFISSIPPKTSINLYDGTAIFKHNIPSIIDDSLKLGTSMHVILYRVQSIPKNFNQILSHNDIECIGMSTDVLDSSSEPIRSTKITFNMCKISSEKWLQSDSISSIYIRNSTIDIANFTKTRSGITFFADRCDLKNVQLIQNFDYVEITNCTGFNASVQNFKNLSFNEVEITHVKQLRGESIYMKNVNMPQFSLKRGSKIDDMTLDGITTGSIQHGWAMFLSKNIRDLAFRAYFNTASYADYTLSTIDVRVAQMVEMINKARKNNQDMLDFELEMIDAGYEEYL